MERNLSEVARGPGEREGDHQRGHGVHRPRRRYRLHRSGARGRPGRIGFAHGDLRHPLSLARKVKLGSLGPLPDVPFNLKTLTEAGVIRPMRPDKLARVSRELARWGASPAAGIIGAAITHPDDVGLIDEARRAHLRRAQPALERARSGACRARTSEPGDGIAIMARNHRGFIDATLAASKLGANGLYMNTAFSGPQLRRRDGARGPGGPDLRRRSSRTCSARRRRTRSGSSPGRTTARPRDQTTDELIESTPTTRGSARRRSRAASSSSRRGRPGRRRAPSALQPDTLSPLAAMFSRIPLQRRASAP